MLRETSGSTCKDNCYRYSSKEQPCPWDFLYADLDEGADDCIDFVGYWDKKQIARMTEIT